MNKHEFSHNQNQKPGGKFQSSTQKALSPAEIGFVPSPDEVARRAYLSYVGEGSRQGRDVQHWLAAEAELIAERNLTRIHGFHNKT
jgi:hypothetical protein